MSDRRPPMDRSGDETINHGTTHGYDKRGCRCPECHEAMKRRWAEIRATKKMAPVPEGAHGRASTYALHGCRCAECVAAHREYQADYRRRNPEVHRRASRAYWNRLSPEERQERQRRTWGAKGENAHAEYKDAWRRKNNAETNDRASKYGQQWTGPELELVVTRTDLSIRELALMLGRTYDAVHGARRRAKNDPKWIGVAGASQHQDT